LKFHHRYHHSVGDGIVDMAVSWIAFVLVATGNQRLVKKNYAKS
jgi:hypothetical protein